MGRVVLYVAVSGEGVIARRGGDISWLRPFEHPDEDYGYGRFFKRVGTVVMGANTYR